LTCIQFLFIAVLVAVSQTWAADETLVLHLKLDEGKGKKVKNEKDFLYKGIGERSFEQSFKLAEFTEVKEVKLEDGVLNVSLVQDLPEEKKEKTIKIS